MANKTDSLLEYGEAFCDELGFTPTSNSTKPLYVANSLFRACTGNKCDVKDVHEWIVSEHKNKAITSEELQTRYASIINRPEVDYKDEIKEFRFYIEKMYNPDSTVFPGYDNSVLNISSRWFVRGSVKAEAKLGSFLYRILNTKIDGEVSPAISVIKEALMQDDDDYTRVVKPIITHKENMTDSQSKSQRDRLHIGEPSEDSAELDATTSTIRKGFDCLAKNCIGYEKRNGCSSLLTLRRMVTYAMFSTFYYLTDINRTKHDGKRVPLLLDTGAKLKSVEHASEACFIACKKTVEDYMVNFIQEKMVNDQVITNPNSKEACRKYLEHGIILTDKKYADKNVEKIILQHFDSNCAAGDKPLLAAAKALQFAVYTYKYPNTTPSDFCYYLGIKSGFVGPGGNGYKRLLANRFFVETIALSSINPDEISDGLELRELGEILREQYYMLIGTDTDIDYDILEKYGIAQTTPEDLRGELSLNTQEFADMLISMGLAKKYADGVTLVGWGL